MQAIRTAVRSAMCWSMVLGCIVTTMHGETLFWVDAVAANVRDFDANGDGKTDDTVALQKALDSVAESGGALYFPPGVYRTGTLKPASHVTLLGHSGWGYGGGRNLGATILTPATDDLECLIDWHGAIGVLWRG